MDPFRRSQAQAGVYVKRNVLPDKDSRLSYASSVGSEELDWDQNTEDQNEKNDITDRKLSCELNEKIQSQFKRLSCDSFQDRASDSSENQSPLDYFQSSNQQGPPFRNLPSANFQDKDTEHLYAELEFGYDDDNDAPTLSKQDSPVVYRHMLNPPALPTNRHRGNSLSPETERTVNLARPQLPRRQQHPNRTSSLTSIFSPIPNVLRRSKTKKKKQLEIPKRFSDPDGYRSKSKSSTDVRKLVSSSFTSSASDTIDGYLEPKFFRKFPSEIDVRSDNALECRPKAFSLALTSSNHMSKPYLENVDTVKHSTNLGIFLQKPNVAAYRSARNATNYSHNISSKTSQPNISMRELTPPHKEKFDLQKRFGIVSPSIPDNVPVIQKEVSFIPPRPPKPKALSQPVCNNEVKSSKIVPNNKSLSYHKEVEKGNGRLSHSDKKDITGRSQEILDDYIWFHRIDMRTTISRLRGMNKENAYLVRPSRKMNAETPYALSIYHNGQVMHISIRKRPDGTFATGTEKSDEKSFPTVQELVHFYHVEPILINSPGQPTKKVLLGNTPRKV